MARHFEEARKNATYRSKTIQNQVIDVIGDLTLQRVIDQIKQHSIFFSIGGDDMLDNATIEQLSTMVRYVDEFGETFMILVCLCWYILLV